MEGGRWLNCGLSGLEGLGGLEIRTDFRAIRLSSDQRINTL